MSKRIAALLVAGALGLSGCAPLGIAAFGVGASAGVSHGLGGVTYRTFTAPMPKVKGATLTALNKMGIKVNSTLKENGAEVIKATAADREIEVELESLSLNTTRIRTVAKKGFFYDSATSTEIILQTERALNGTT
ncbi:MAG TPA: DUF3568 family protein [Burkholderiales bacterium]|nr:DUF3568 family protein [Burkholderiales bacterium]